MSDLFSNELALGHSLVKLCQETKARSGWVQHGSQLVESNLAASETRVGQMAGTVHEMVAAYSSVGRIMESIVFGYGEHYLLISCEAEMRVALLFPRKSGRVGGVFTRARRFLREQRGRILEVTTGEPAPNESVSVIEEVQSHWPVVEERLTGLLAKVIGSGQAKRQIVRALQDFQVVGEPDFQQIAPIAKHVIEKVPHRGKQQALMAELADFLSELGIS